jgi:hypothetical protein
VTGGGTNNFCEFTNGSFVPSFYFFMEDICQSLNSTVTASCAAEEEADFLKIELRVGEL